VSRLAGVDGSEGVFLFFLKCCAAGEKPQLVDTLRFGDEGTKMEIWPAWWTIKGVVRTHKGVLWTKKGSADDKPL